VTVTVMLVEIALIRRFDYINLSCGHAVMLSTEADPMSTVNLPGGTLDPHTTARSRHRVRS
jgi:hypothetical protein